MPVQLAANSPLSAWFRELERIWQEPQTPPGARAEMIDGEIVVSPSGSVRHSAGQPGSDGYTSRHNAASGQPLHRPGPFGIDLDPARLLR